MRYAKICGFILLLLFAATISGCQIAVSGKNAEGLIYEVRPAIIIESSIVFDESYPVQVFLHVKCEITDSATTLDEITVGKLTDNTITVTITTKRSKLAPVSPTIDSFQQDVNLGSTFKPSETYAVVANDKTLSFKMQ